MQSDEQICKFALTASGELDELIVFAERNCEPEEVAKYRQAIGRIMHDIWSHILKPIYDRNPDMKTAHFDDKLR